MSNVRIIPGPPTSKVSKAQAEAGLTQHKDFPAGADFALDVVEGRWVAAFTVEAAPPPFGAPSEEEPSGPPSPDGPPSDGPPGEEGPPSDDSEGGDEPKGDGEKKDKGKGGEKAELSHVLDMLTTICTALGIDPMGLSGEGDSPVPGMDGPPGGPPAPEGPPGLDGPPGGPGAMGDPHGDKQHVVHERSLKPGEVPPGGTPLGAPAFASVRDDHPWKAVAQVKRSFEVEEEIGDFNLANIASELNVLASEIPGLRVGQLIESSNNGKRTAKALITR